VGHVARTGEIINT